MNSNDTEQDVEAYIVKIEDRFRVNSDEVDSEEEACEMVLNRLGDDPFNAYKPTVVGVE